MFYLRLERMYYKVSGYNKNVTCIYGAGMSNNLEELAALLDSAPVTGLVLDIIVSLCEMGHCPSDEFIDDLAIFIAQLIDTSQKTRRRSA